jgi:hypothetical protein
MALQNEALAAPIKGVDGPAAPCCSKQLQTPSTLHVLQRQLGAASAHRLHLLGGGTL